MPSKVATQTTKKIKNNMAKIKKIKAREILDSRGNPTVEVELETENGIFTASVPSGASVGKYEAHELRDEDESRYNGKGVLKAVENVNSIIAPKLKGENVKDQAWIDKIMIDLDATPNKATLGANAILAVSLAVCKAGAASYDYPLWKYIAKIAKNKEPKLPKPFLLVIEGGKHAGNKITLQEFMVVPKMETFSEMIRKTSAVYSLIGDILRERYGKGATNVGYEGAYAALGLEKTDDVLTLINEAFVKNGVDKTMKVAIDAAASSFIYDKDHYNLEDFKTSREQLVEFYTNMADNHSIYSLEDPFGEDDFEGFKEITKKIGKKIVIIGDDLLVTNPEKIQKAIDEKLCNGLLLKLNQIGTVTEALVAAAMAREAKWDIVVSHRSGETNDDFIADFAVGIGAEAIKTGAPCRGERVAKYNRLLKIEEELK